MVQLSKAASAPPRRVLVAEDDRLLASLIARELAELGIEVVGPVATVASAIEQMAANDGLSGAILDIHLGGEPVYPVAGALSARDVPFVFWTGYGRPDLPALHRSASVVQKPANGEQLVQALFDRVRRDQAPAIEPFPLSDVYMLPDGEFVLMIRAGRHLEQDDGLTWVGSTFLDRAAWGRSLRTPLVAGAFYRVPPRYVVNLKAQLTILG